MNKADEKNLLRIQNPPMEGWCSHEKAVELFNLVESTKPKLCVEIGVFGGRSLVAIAMGLQKLGEGIIFGIDPWNIDACLEGTSSDVNKDWWANVPWEGIIGSYFDKIQEFELLSYTSHIAKHDKDCLCYFADGSIDLIHFDSNHSEEVSCRTVKDWWPKLKQGSVIIMDDIDWDGQDKALILLKSLGVKVIKEYLKFGIYSKP